VPAPVVPIGDPAGRSTGAFNAADIWFATGRRTKSTTQKAISPIIPVRINPGCWLKKLLLSSSTFAIGLNAASGTFELKLTFDITT